MRVTCLSVRQPWCDLLRAGVKDVENRSWTTSYRGVLYLHAGVRFDTDGYEFLRRNAEHMFGVPADEALLPKSRYATGAILGRVVLRDIALYQDVPVDEVSPWHEEDQYGWYVENAEAFASPIPCKGQLGLFQVDVDERAIRVLEV